MLETEEVDVDYFTPSTSTSLSKIFASSAKEEDSLEKSSLKYNAPLPPQVVTKPEEPKQTQYIFAGTVYAYEWVNNTYESRGRLGFAIFKIANYEVHKMVIYDFNKTTLSSLTIGHNVQIKVNGNMSISYYDNLQKFWSVSPSTHQFKEVVEILRSLNVNLEDIPSGKSPENKTLTLQDVDTIKLNECEKESDTDGAFNRKTKDSILKRMATMGQSVLPPPYAMAVPSSDSSDTNEPQNQQKPKHKPKIASKKGLLEKKTNTDKTIEANPRITSPKPDASNDKLKNVLNIEDSQQIVPLMNTSIKPQIEYSGGESYSLGLFITEQKVNNSELRCNINRMADKLDVLLDKVKDLDIVDKDNSVNNTRAFQFQNNIILKLLNEYEKKITKYEEIIKLKGFDCDSFELTSQPMKDSKQEHLQNTDAEIQNLHQLCNEKDKEILRLKEELQLLSNKEGQFQIYEKKLLKEISDLKSELKASHIANVSKKVDETNIQTTDITNKVKQIMNDTFQAISVNFDDEETYSGTNIKSVVGLVVKRTTIDSLKQF